MKKTNTQIETIFLCASNKELENISLTKKNLKNIQDLYTENHKKFAERN